MTKPSPALGVSLFILLFFIKTVILALWVTPMWDIPDETGHLAYTIELAATHKLPVMGESIIDWYIMETVQEGNFAPELNNTISQHPPVYYLFTSLMWKAGTLITDHRDLLFRIPRLVASVAGCLTLLFVYRLMLLLTRRVSISFGAMALISFIPMFTHLSAGVNNDIMTMMFSTIAVFYWARY
ncbi:MAG: glycosyltransferase family 39 protein, partial [Kiritimatiellia bacterium]